MAYFIALGILSLAGIVGTVWLVRTDGYGRIPTDPQRAAPASTASRARSRRPEADAAPRDSAAPAPHASAAPMTAPLRAITAE